MLKWHKTFLLAIFCLLLPINIYIIGDWIGAGIQSSFLRFQVTERGTSVISNIQEFNYLISGIISGRSAISISFWLLGFILLIGNIVVILAGNYIPPLKEKVNIFCIIAGSCFLISLIVQYGPLFHGPAGIAIPIGLPVLFVIGGWIYIEGQKDEAGDEDDDMQAIIEKAG
jgi:hypothetical protein